MHKPNNISKVLITILIVFNTLSVYAQNPVRLTPVWYGQESATKKFERALDLVNRHYVDTVDNQYLVEQAIIGMLKQLDPHSNYYTAEQIKRATEDLEGSFEGVGVEYQIFDDTAMIMKVHEGGPADKAGMKQGDQMVQIGAEDATGNSINNNWISTRIRGEHGSEVLITVLRSGFEEPLILTVARDKITTYSVEVFFMLDSKTGYIRISRFMRTTAEEFEKAIKVLRKQGMEKMILDLRGNTGGYLNAAVNVADHFLGHDKIIVYIEGVNNPRIDYKTTGKGDFRDGKVVVLIDENSASASEILTGAIQDWDRGLVIGRRSYGKGLVQKPYSFSDGSAVRLTIARYYTPVGRCIQRPYDKGRDKYFEELNEKIRKGIYSTVDSMNLHDSLRHITPGGKVVYGGGGIMPDILVSDDTTGRSEFLTALSRRNMFNRYALFMIRNHKDSLMMMFPDASEFDNNLHLVNNMLPQFLTFAEAQQIKLPESMYPGQQEAIERQLRVVFGRLLFGSISAAKVQSRFDNLIVKALEVIDNYQAFEASE